MSLRWNSEKWQRRYWCLLDSFKHYPIRTMLCLRFLNPFSGASWARFSLMIHGEDFLIDLFEAGQAVRMKPFMAWGTLLGYVREGALIKHDTDIDVGLLAEDWSKRSLLIQKMESRGYILEFNDAYKLRFVRRDRITHLDIDVFFPWNGKMICIHMTEDGWHAGAWFPLYAFDNFRRVTFLDREMLIPEPPEVVLETIYGNWRVPVLGYDCRVIPNRLHLPEGAEKPRLPE